MAHLLVQSALSSIFKLLPDEMRPGQDRIEVSLIRQCASSMPELGFHRDVRRQVFVLMLACNINDGAEMSVRDTNKVPFDMDATSRYEKFGIPFPSEEERNYYCSNRPSLKGNGYLIREGTATDKQFVQHGRGAYFSKVDNPERITLRILIDSMDQPVTEVK